MTAFKDYQIKLDATGAGTLRIAQNLSGVMWDVTQINISTNPASAACIATLFFNTLYMSNTIAGSNDSAAGPPSVRMLSGDELSVVWASGPANGLATAVIFVDEYPLK